jgi:hypothetical protein
MRFLTAIRRRQLRAPHLVAAIFAIGWLGFAVAPCQAMPQHESMPNCGDCPSAPSGLDSGCAMVASADCQSAGLAIHDTRHTEFPQSAAAPPPAFPGVDAFLLDGGPSRDSRVHRLPVSHVSLQQRYCTYLN